ncbi:unnamed protein product [Parnassius apollo]|uniref:(apollo) hypothetical protein n=1 Tax=Parnassius apollo TaxID=110799 RepID=A0A8S3X385_PARAO|nr:unnamed protein product [Parnassius apollo]
MSIFILVQCFCFISATMAGSAAEVKELFLQQITECNKEHPINAEEINMLQKHIVPESKTGRCHLACLFRKTKWMDEKGMFVLENAVKLAEEKHPKDSAKLENSRNLFELCKKVNEETFSDGEEGCERAAKLSTCLTENAKKFGFQLE